MDQKNSILKFLTKEKKESENSKSISQFVENRIGKQTHQQKKSVNDPSTETKEVNELREKLAEEKEKNKKLLSELKMSMTLVKNAAITNLSKDAQIEKLTKQFQKTTISPQSDPKTIKCQSQFSEFSGVFSDHQLKKLRSIKSGKTKDSKFILECMRFLYPDPTVLNDRSVTGKAFNKQKKCELTPTKINIMKKILNQRLESEEDLSEYDAFIRLERVNKLMKDAIGKLRPSKKNVNEQSEEICPTIQPATAALHSTTAAAEQSNYPYAYQPLTHQITLPYNSLLGYNQSMGWSSIQIMPNYTIAAPNTVFQAQMEHPNHLK